MTPEDPVEQDTIERLARRTAELNDEKARQRQIEMLNAFRGPRKYPPWFVWLGVICLVIGLAPLFVSCGIH